MTNKRGIEYVVIIRGRGAPVPRQVFVGRGGKRSAMAYFNRKVLAGECIEAWVSRVSDNEYGQISEIVATYKYADELSANAAEGRDRIAKDGTERQDCGCF